MNFPVSCSPAVRADFDRAVAMLHSFFYPETEKAFRRIAEREPSCAMAYWGIAISQRPNPLVTPLPPRTVEAGMVGDRAGARGRVRRDRARAGLDRGAGALFQDADTVDQNTRTAKYEAAMARLQARYPKDREAAIFHALSLEAVDLTDKTYARQLKAAGLLEGCRSADPDHPGIVHYLIHGYDYAPIAERGLPAARRYAALAPSAPHALHMPSHTFSTLGMWPDAIAPTSPPMRRSVPMPRMNPAGGVQSRRDHGRYHGLDFLTNAYLQLAQDRAAAAIVDARNSVGTLPPAPG